MLVTAAHADSQALGEQTAHASEAQAAPAGSA